MAEKKASIEAQRNLEAGEEKSPQQQPPKAPEQSSGGLHPAVYIIVWIALSGSVILFNKWVLSTAKFGFPLFLTTWHMVFAACMTQILARFTNKLDSRHKVPMTPQVYMRAIVPIGLMFSLSLIFSNVAYIYLSVSFIQMLKATNAVATLVATWIFGLAAPDMKKLANVSLIVIGVAIASYGEIKFDLIGFLIQAIGIVCEATRLVMVQRLLSSADFKMDPMVSLYYFAPACGVINAIFTAFFELPKMSMADIYGLGIGVLLANAMVAFGLNVAVVLLIGKTSAVVLTLSGVLKDILLVMASLLIFGDPVTPLQWFGYAVALGGLMYYRLGGEKMQQASTQAKLAFNGFRNEHPQRMRAALIGTTVVGVLLLLWVWWPTVAATSG